jgi:hypothetical protein
LIQAAKYFLLLSIVSALFFSCRKEDEFTDDADAKLSFSLDTVMFDTVFSQVAPYTPMSVTKQLWVVNHNEKGVKVNIRIAGNQYGVFKINVDGQPATTGVINQKEIRGKDSIVIFVQVYINNPDAAKDLPFIVTDQLVFETNGNIQDVDLVAFAQNAIYLNNAVLDCNAGNLHWTAERPYVIYDSILVPKGCTLTIDAGAKIHSHVKSSILVAGTLVVNGTQDNPVIFEGDRLDQDYRNGPGQWAGIHILPGSTDNVVTHAVIKNGLIGIRVDSASANQNPNLLLRNTIIKNMSSVGLLGFSANITAINNAIVNCGQFTFYGRFGGDYKLYHNTFAAYNINFNRQNEQFLLDNSPLLDEDGNITSVFPLTVTMINNIVYGSQEEEIILNNDPKGGAVTLTMQNNLLKTQIESLMAAANTISNKDPKFTNVAEDNFVLEESSPAKGKGIFININSDLLEKSRSTSAPTIGAYE